MIDAALDDLLYWPLYVYHLAWAWFEDRRQYEEYLAQNRPKRGGGGVLLSSSIAFNDLFKETLEEMHKAAVITEQELASLFTEAAK